MQQELQRLYLNEMTQQKMYKIFGLRKVSKLQSLEEWLSDLPELNEEERTVAQLYQARLLENIDNWNEQELSLGFIGPILNLIPFKIPYKLNLFAQRPIHATVENYELVGKPDGILASGFQEPEVPYFSFHEYKKEIDSTGDPAGQNLAAMLAGQSLNETDNRMYGCYVVGRNWFFMALEGKEYAISKAYSADDFDELIEIIRVLKGLKERLFKKIGTNT
ncbi:MAG: hypothetical protein AAGG68_27640 [Bacteroidota bacterium]